MYDIEKILSKKTNKRLTKALKVCMVSQVSRLESAYNDLRLELGELFTIRRVSLYPDDVLVDLAEAIQDLYVEQNDNEEYIHHTKKYLKVQIKNYRELRKKYNHKANWRRGSIKSLEDLDLIYLNDSYSRGYHKNRASMHRTLLSLVEQIEREGVR